MNKYSANQDIRDYMADHGVTQKMLADELGISTWTMCQQLKTEFPQQKKDHILNIIDALETKNLGKDQPEEEPDE